MDRPRNGWKSAVSGLLAPTLVALAYFITGRLGLQLAVVQENVTLIWPPTGISIAALCLLGPRLVIGVLGGAMMVNASMGAPLGVSAAISTGNSLEALLGWALLRHFKFDVSLCHMRDVGVLLVAVLLASTVSASIGVGTLYSAGAVEGSDALLTWSRWWAGDAAGGVIVAPLVFVLFRGVPPWRELYGRFEPWAVVLLLLIGSSLSFGSEIDRLAARALTFALFVLLVWAGLRLGQRGAVISGVLTSVIAVVGTAQGFGPFADENTNVQILSLWAFVTTNGAIVLILAAAVAEREKAMEKVINMERSSRELEAQMQHVQRLESLGVLAGGVAHDFNNLLTVIRGNANLIEMAQSDRERAQLVGQIETTTIRAAELCQQLLTYSGKALPQMKSVDLRALTEELTSLLASSISKKVRLELNFEPGTPAVSGDPALLRQIFLNLIINAAEAVGDEVGTVLVSTGMQNCDREYLDRTFLPSDAPAGDFVAITVQDDGVGMEPETMQRVFDPFFSTKFAGRGLGLAAVVGAVRAHGGAIKVESTPGEGTRLIVLLRPASTEPEAHESESPTTGVHGGRWLFVDDEQEVREYGIKALKTLGAEVQEAVDGVDAIRLLDSLMGDLAGVVVDLTMPGKGGKQVIEWIRDQNRSLPIVLMSGYPLAEDYAVQVAYLPKPFSPGELSRALDEAIEIAGIESE